MIEMLVVPGSRTIMLRRYGADSVGDSDEQSTLANMTFVFEIAAE